MDAMDGGGDMTGSANANASTQPGRDQPAKHPAALHSVEIKLAGHHHPRQSHTATQVPLVALQQQIGLRA